MTFGKLFMVGAAIIAAMILGSTVDQYGTTALLMRLGGIIGVILLLLTLAKAGIRGAATLMIYSGFGVLGVTALRVSDSVALSDVFFLGAAGLLMAAALLTRLPIHIDARLRLLVLGGMMLIGGSLIASIFAADASASLSAWIKLVIAVILLPLLLIVWSPSVKEIHIISVLFIVSASASALAAYVIGPPNQYTNRAYGLATHPNSLAMISVLALGPALALMLSSNTLTRIAFGLASFGLSWSILIPSGSRAGVLGMVVVILSLLLLTRSRTLFIGSLVTGLCVFFLLRSGALDLLGFESVARLIGAEDTSQRLEAQMSNEGRWALLQDTWSDFRSKPFIGVGVEHARTAHNVYLSVLVSCGVIAFAGLFIVMWDVLKAAVIVQRSTQRLSNLKYWLLIGWISGYAGLMFANAFQNSLWERFVWVPPTVVALLMINRSGPQADELQYSKKKMEAI
jgi:O-antigen ligase